MAGSGSDNGKGGGAKLPPALLLTLGALAVLAAIVAGAFYLSRTLSATGPSTGVAAAKAEGRFARYATGEMAQLVTHARPLSAPKTAFQDPQRATVDLSAFKGQVVVLNLWATWCKPCLTEMPTLDAVQQAYAGKGLKVVALNVDLEAKYADAKDFIGVYPALELYHDPKNIQGVYQTLEGKGLPMTVVFDRQGREIARLTGGADWNSPEARAFFDAALATR